MRSGGPQQVLWITVVWVVLSLCEFAYTYGALSAYGVTLPASQARILFGTAVFSGLLAGLTGGWLIVYVFDRWLRERSYGSALLRILTTFTSVFFGISILSGFYLHTQELRRPPWDPAVVRRVFSIFVEWDSMRTYAFWFVVVLLTTVVLLVRQKYGPGAFRDFLLGRYFRPRREERVFMFLDLRGSTAWAERLGEEAYFRLLQELFRDLTPPILESRGEIYQYVGDEVVVSWPRAVGLEEGRCLGCFEGIQRTLAARAPVYRERYGGRPEFKAGIHGGSVVAGEVGVVKREIAYSGDVLNTAARIQGMCNELGVDLLLSQSLADGLPPRRRSTLRSLGPVLLRGKAEESALYTVAGAVRGE